MRTLIKDFSEKNRLLDSELKMAKKDFEDRETQIRRNISSLEREKLLAKEQSNSEITRLKDELDRRAEESGSLREELDFVRRALFVAEGRLKEALERDAEREESVRRGQKRREEEEQFVHKVLLKRPPQFLSALLLRKFVLQQEWDKKEANLRAEIEAREEKIFECRRGEEKIEAELTEAKLREGKLQLEVKTLQQSLQSEVDKGHKNVSILKVH